MSDSKDTNLDTRPVVRRDRRDRFADDAAVFQASVGHVLSDEEAKRSSDLIEKALGEIANGQRKASQLSLPDLINLVAFARQKLVKSPEDQALERLRPYVSPDDLEETVHTAAKRVSDRAWEDYLSV